MFLGKVDFLKGFMPLTMRVSEDLGLVVSSFWFSIFGFACFLACFFLSFFFFSSFFFSSSFIHFPVLVSVAPLTVLFEIVYP